MSQHYERNFWLKNKYEPEFLIIYTTNVSKEIICTCIFPCILTNPLFSLDFLGEQTKSSKKLWGNLLYFSCSSQLLRSLLPIIVSWWSRALFRNWKFILYEITWPNTLKLSIFLEYVIHVRSLLKLKIYLFMGFSVPIFCWFISWSIDNLLLISEEWDSSPSTKGEQEEPEKAVCKAGKVKRSV